MSINGNQPNNPYGESDVDPYDYDYQPYGNQGYQPPTAFVNPTIQTANVNIETNGAIGDEALRLKAMELARREQDLEKREKLITDREEQLPQSKKNWPKCYPIVHHSIGEVPEEFMRRKLAYVGYIGWMAFVACLACNMIAAYITCFYPSGELKRVDLIDKIQYLIMSTIQFVIGSLAHFFLSYWTLYKAMEVGNVPRFVLFFVGYGAAILYAALGVAGLFTYGFSGVYTAVVFFPQGTNGSIPGFVCNLIMGVVWFCFLILFLAIFILGIKIFRALKGSVNAIKEYATEQVNAGVGTAVSSVVKGAFTGGSNQNV
ncbi:hypothetical protein ABK040_016495 [Willaertia magna]